MSADVAPALIALRGVGKHFRDGQIEALRDVSFDVRPGEFISLIGASGCGKTTLLRMMNGLIAPDSGSVLLDGAPPRPGPDLAMVFQSARLMPWRTVSGNVEFVLARRGVPRSQRRARSRAFLEAVGLGGFADAWPHELSGGMQQRVGLTRALAAAPRVLLMDEPFAALDALTREVMRADLLRLWAREKIAVVFVTHDIDEAVLLSQRIVLLCPRPGRVDRVVEVDLPQPRWQTDVRRLPRFAELRQQLWQRLRDLGLDDAGAAAPYGEH